MTALLGVVIRSDEYRNPAEVSGQVCFAALVQALSDRWRSESMNCIPKWRRLRRRFGYSMAVKVTEILNESMRWVKVILLDTKLVLYW